MSWNFNDPDLKWFLNAKLNITENIFERNIEKFGSKTAIIWEPNDPNEKSLQITYNELFQKTCQFSNVLQDQGISKGDRVIIICR